MYTFMKLQTNHSCGGVKLRLSLQCVICWWHLELKEECVLQLTTKFGRSVKIKAIQELEWGIRCVISDISSWKLCKDGSTSKYVPSAVVLSRQRSDVKITKKYGK